MAMNAKCGTRTPDLVSVLIDVVLRREGVPLFVVQVLLQVEEGVEEDGGHPTGPQVGQTNLGPLLRTNHVEHLE